MRSRSSRGRDSKSEKVGSGEMVCCVADASLVEGLLCDKFLNRTGRLGVCGGASTMVVSDESLLPDEERDRGVEVREAMSSITR